MNDVTQANYAGNPDLNASVSASAGTGKTYLLVSRIIRLLLDRARPDSILALTFTRKASGEMQQRLHERLWRLAISNDKELQTELQNCGIDKPDTELLQQARELYEQVLFTDRNIRISTFHAFCQDLLSRFPLEADIPPGFELIENTGILEEAAWNALFLEATKSPNSTLAEALEILFNACNGLQNTQASLLSGFLGHRSDWWAYTENQHNPVEYAYKQLMQLLTYTEKPCDQFLQKYKKDIEEFSSLLGKNDTKTNLDFIVIIEAGLKSAKAMAAYELISTAFLTQSGEARKRTASNTLIKKMGETGVERFIQLHEIICVALLETQDALLQNESLVINKAWYIAGDALIKHYQRIKQEQRSLDFADLEWETYKLLNHPDNALWIQYKIDQKIDHLLIDEFQDTNPTQWQLILPLLEELASGQSDRKRSVFLVGDTKQSIYGFRRANPKLQQTASTWLQNKLQAQHFTLSHSRRSSPAIIQALNNIFYNNGTVQQIDNFPKHETHENSWGVVEILPLIQIEKHIAEETLSLRDPLLEGRTTSESTMHYLEGQQVAERIQTLIQNQTVIGTGEAARLLDYNDIIILMRSRNHAAEYERALNEHHIPYIGIERGTLLDSLEVQDMEALLNYLVTPFNNLLLAQILRSPLFNVTDTELLMIARESSSHNWQERLKILIDNKSATGNLQRAYKLLTRWESIAGRFPVHDLLDQIYNEGNVLARYKAATPESSQDRVMANLNRFIEMALEVDSGRYPGMASFVSRLKKMRSVEQDQADTPPYRMQQSQVRLMTIHAAKGLESSVVFLVNSASTPKSDNAYKALIDWPAEANKPTHFLLSLDKARQAQSIKQLLEYQSLKDKAEQANLLYVALSRAKQLLFISGCASTRTNKDESEKQIDLDWYSAITDSIAPSATLLKNGCYQLSHGTMPAALSKKTFKETKISHYPAGLHQSFAAPAILDKSSPSSTTDKQNLTDSDQTQSIEQRRGIYIHFYLQQLCQDNNLTDLSTLTRDIQITDAQLLEWQEEALQTFENPKFSFLFDKSQYNKAWTEIPVHYKSSDEHSVHGIIDRLVLKGEKLFLIDYKTHAEVNPSNIEKIAAQYKNQLRLYAEGIRKLWLDKTVETSIIFTADQTRYIVES